jgi:hypothetical protein
MDGWQQLRRGSQIWKMGSPNFRTDVNARFSDVGARFTILTWAVGINGAATIAILDVLLRGHGP